MSETYTSVEQQADLMKFISDNISIPIMGAGGGFAPIGTINFFDASIAPQGWLACDGSVVNIADYPDLATYYASVHGASNFYGGDGTTTFAVPDLRGEFLRGTGTNGHTNQGDGANVGVHQDGTEHNTTWVTSGNNGIASALKNGVVHENDKTDSYVNTADSFCLANATYTPASFLTIGSKYTSRPTNTSFLICVKATVSGDANAHQYSTEEQVVGMDEDGNIEYEKTLTGTWHWPSSKSWTPIAHNIANVNKIRVIESCVYPSNDVGATYPLTYYDGTNYAMVNINQTNMYFLGNGLNADCTYRIVARYTKTQ